MASHDIQRMLHVDQGQPKGMSRREPRNALLLDAQTLEVFKLSIDKPLNRLCFHGLDFCAEYSQKPAARAWANGREWDFCPVAERGDVREVEDHPEVRTGFNKMVRRKYRTAY